MERRIYIIAHALEGKGIISTIANVYTSPIPDDSDMYAFTFKDNLEPYYIIGSNAFYTMEEAVKKAEEIRNINIANLKKEIKRLEELKFE